MATEVNKSKREFCCLWQSKHFHPCYALKIGLEGPRVGSIGIMQNQGDLTSYRGAMREAALATYVHPWLQLQACASKGYAVESCRGTASGFGI